MSTVTGTPPPKLTEEQKRRPRIRAKALRKQRLIRISSEQAMYAKARLIEAGKGRNGKSMNQKLTEAHFGIR